MSLVIIGSFLLQKNETERKKKLNMSKKEINEILDEMEEKREMTIEKPRIPQYNGFRKEWSDYLTENIDNLYY